MATPYELPYSIVSMTHAILVSDACGPNTYSHTHLRAYIHNCRAIGQELSAFTVFNSLGYLFCLSICERFVVGSATHANMTTMWGQQPDLAEGLSGKAEVAQQQCFTKHLLVGVKEAKYVV